ncbi:MAG: mechanosensitive ion channel family protein [Bryobacterales bacterium]|nr:mechanosensitive ion channel family protein [Bryobacterales bacterium]
MDWKALEQSLVTTAVAIGTKLLGALAVYIVGRWLIGMVMRVLARVLRSYKLDETVMAYLSSILSVLLNIVLVMGILGYFGVETTSFAALLAGAGLAIGTAWGGLLAHFAAGVFMLILRPFKVGDFVTAGGVTGTVHEIGLFTTTIIAPDNVVNHVGNNKVFSDTIQNFSTNAYRRVDLTAQLAHAVDPGDAVGRLRAAVAKIPNVLTSPAPDVEIGTFNERGPVLIVRPYTSNDHYWQVYFDTNRAIRETFAAAGYPVPEEHVYQREIAVAASAASGSR